MLNESDGKYKGYEEVANKRQKEIERIEYQHRRVVDEADFLKDRNNELESIIKRKDQLVAEMEDRIEGMKKSEEEREK